jgi:ubiquinone/menaquinone biosynthesis C-methylase UbiE
MCFHQTRLFAWLLDVSMRQRRLLPCRERIIGAACGRILEIGIGSGLNLPLYRAAAERVIGLDPSWRLLAMAHERMRGAAAPVDLIEGSAEAIPLQDASADTVVTTWTMCSIPDAPRALREMRRVLKPSGRLLFVEHGRSPDVGVRWWQDHLTPAWKRLSGGCHLNRDIGGLIEGAGFRIERLDTGYLQRRNPMAFLYEGSARPR